MKFEGDPSDVEVGRGCYELRCKYYTCIVTKWLNLR